MADAPKAGTMAAGKARYKARHGNREAPTETPTEAGMTRLQRGAARYRPGVDRAALRAQAEADSGARTNPFAGGDAA